MGGNNLFMSGFITIFVVMDKKQYVLNWLDANVGNLYHDHRLYSEYLNSSFMFPIRRTPQHPSLVSRVDHNYHFWYENNHVLGLSDDLYLVLNALFGYDGKDLVAICDDWVSNNIVAEHITGHNL